MAGRRSREFPSLTPQLLLRAYSIGLFPMADSADDPEIFWVEPELRGILPLNEFHVSRSLRKAIKQKPFAITRNAAFSKVVAMCAESAPDRPSTWINSTIRTLYDQLHAMGHAHSVEAWQGDRLVGGLYGVSLGAAFFGESMFSRETNASKICLVHLVDHLNERGFRLLDTQFTTEHLKTFGAIDVPKKQYLIMLKDAIEPPGADFV